MTIEHKHTILLVDDEKSITKALNRLFRKDGYQILTASSGKEGLEILKKIDQPVSLIISDQRMPGMNGAEFLENAKKIFPDAIRFLLTGYSDMDAIVDAVNKGEIHRYLTKPWNDEDMLLQTRQAVEQLELIAENRRLSELTNTQNKKLNELNKNLESKVKQRTKGIINKNKDLMEVNKKLEKNFIDTIKLLVSLIGSLNPVLGEYMRHVGLLSKEVAAKFGFGRKELDQIEMAGMIHDIGLLGLPARILEKDESDMTKTEFNLFSQHPVIAATCLEPVEELEKIAEIILHHHEHYNGGGFPGGLKGDTIPLAARIIGTVADYCKIVYTWPRETNQIIARTRKYSSIFKDIVIAEPVEMLTNIAKRVIMLNARKKYDIQVVKAFLAIAEKSGKSENKKHNLRIDFKNLQPGMIIEEDLRLNDGRLLLPNGAILKKSSIESIQVVARQKLITKSIPVSF